MPLTPERLQELKAFIKQKVWVDAKLASELIKVLESEREETHQRIEQLCKDLNQAHDQVLEAQECKNPQGYDWPEWTPQANSIRWAEKLLGKKLAKTDSWTLFPEKR